MFPQRDLEKPLAQPWANTRCLSLCHRATMCWRTRTPLPHRKTVKGPGSLLSPRFQLTVTVSGRCCAVPSSPLPSGRALGDPGVRGASVTAGTPTGAEHRGWGSQAATGTRELSVGHGAGHGWFFRGAGPSGFSKEPNEKEASLSLCVFSPSPRSFPKSLRLSPLEISVWADSHRKGLQSCSLWDAFLTFFGLSSMCFCKSTQTH